MQRTCGYCGIQFVAVKGVTAYRYCTPEHAIQAKKARDNARPEPSKEDRKRWNSTYRSNNVVAIRHADNAYKKRVRAERGRGDRMTEYDATAIKRYGMTKSQRAELRQKEGQRVELVAAKKREQKAIDRANKPKVDEATEWRDRYRNDPAFRQQEIQRLKKAKLKRKAAMQSSLTKAQTIAVYAERSTCLYCGCSLDERSKTLDHMDPLSKGGCLKGPVTFVHNLKCLPS